MEKNYLVIGGSSGIGKKVVHKMQKQGNVVATFNHHPVEKDGSVEYVKYDIASDDGLDLEVDRLDGLIYCPGTINLKPFHRLNKEDFLEDFNINLLGAVKSIQGALPLLKKSDNASIVMFSTVAVQQGMSFHASVAASKGAIEGLTRSLAAELAPKIRVNAVAPSLVDTPLASRLLSSEEKKKASEKRHPLQKIGSTEDIASMVEFLLSEQSGWITGQIFSVDGGMSGIKMLS
jgi:NAD(P)-dependent dehydrogenase (short-subunit alcohol dehydrogenase family)